MSLISVGWTLFRSSGQWNEFDFDGISGKGDKLFKSLSKLDALHAFFISKAFFQLSLAVA